MVEPASRAIHVAVGVLRNARGDVLIARRPAHVHQGGYWEFPGGKVMPGETVKQALGRELREELGIELEAARPLIRIHHAYADSDVLLDVWQADTYIGQPRGREGQLIQWTAPNRLAPENFPAANRPIISAVRLPSYYVISDEPRDGTGAFLATLQDVLAAGNRLLQLRAKSLQDSQFRQLAQRALALCRSHDADLLLNALPHWVDELGAAGVHLPSQRLMALDERPLGHDKWVAASCHNAAEVAHACRIGVDFIVVAPVSATASHPGAAVHGWGGLQALTEQATVPVYALGGMTPQHVPSAYRHGAQGIAGISSLWRSRRDGDL